MQLIAAAIIAHHWLRGVPHLEGLDFALR